MVIAFRFNSDTHGAIQNIATDALPTGTTAMGAIIAPAHVVGLYAAVPLVHDHDDRASIDIRLKDAVQLHVIQENMKTRVVAPAPEACGDMAFPLLGAMGKALWRTFLAVADVAIRHGVIHMSGDVGNG
jgi:hypothetical protein